MTDSPLRPMLRRLVALPVASLVLASLLGGCTGGTSTPTPSPEASASPSSSPDPSPSPSPVPPTAPDRLPALETLSISTEGLGSLRLNAPVSESDMAVWVPDACAEYYTEGSADGIEIGRWVANYDTPDGNRPFAVATSESGGGNVIAVEVYSEELVTLSGIRIGSTMEELSATYPELVLLDTGDFSSLYEVSDGVGSVRFEVIDDAEFWPEFASRVSSILVVSQESPGSTRAGSGALLDACF